MDEKPAEALEKLLPLYETAPANIDVAINLGGAYILLRKWDKAAQVLRRAVELEPDNVILWINLGAAELGRLELSGPRQQARAIHAYERALAIDPRTPNADYHLGLIHKERKDFVRAAAAFDAALRLDPNAVRALASELAQAEQRVATTLGLEGGAAQRRR